MSDASGSGSLADIQNKADIQLLVDSFYSRVREHAELGPIFNEKLADRWPEHLHKMYAFWATLLLAEYSYRGHPFEPHATLPIGEVHFTAWLKLFRETLNELFSGPIAEQALLRANMIAGAFSKRMYVASERT